MKRQWLAIVVLFVLLPAAIRGDEPKAADLPPELRWIPANAAAFVHIRFGDLWSGPAGKPIRDELGRGESGAIERIERVVGVKLGQIDRITLMIPESNGGAPGGVLVVRIRTTETYDPAQVRKMLGLPPGPRFSDLTELPGSIGMFHFTDAKTLTLVFARIGAAAAIAKLEKVESAGRLAPALKLAAEGHLIVAAADVSQARRLSWLADIPEMRRYFIARSAVLVGDVKPAGLALSLRFTAGLRGHAEEVADALERDRGELLALLAGAARIIAGEPGGANRAKLLLGFASALKAAKVDRKDKEVAVTATAPDAAALAALALEGVEVVQCAASRAASQNYLKQFGLAFHNYHDTFGFLPAAVRDKAGKPLLSWRVAILPQIEQQQLYRQFKLDEPWDSEHNKKLIAKMPVAYLLPGERKKYELASTHYRVFVNNGAAFDMKQDTSFASITDGLSNTIMVVEAAEAVPWTKPDELEYDPKKTPKLNYVFGRASVLFCDGSVRTLRKSLPEATLHLLIQRADGNVIPNID